MKKSAWIVSALVGVVGIFGCQEISGDCWPVSEDGQGAGVGGGPLIPGSGGFGNVPPEPQDDTEEPPPAGCNVEEETEEKPEEKPKGDSSGSCGGPAEAGMTTADGTTFAHCSAECAAKCPAAGVNGFSPSVFKFTTTIPDDGKDAGGGYQVASATLSFFRWTSWLPQSWACPVTVGMPIRTKEYGTFTPNMAAGITAGIASDASFSLMKVTPELPPGIFCSKLVYTMRDLFKAKYPNLGASVTL